VAWGKDFEESMQQLTRYRRRIRRPNADNAHPAVIYNDFLNCLWATRPPRKDCR
jgi:alpha-galactosidase